MHMTNPQTLVSSSPEFTLLFQKSSLFPELSPTGANTKQSRSSDAYCLEGIGSIVNPTSQGCCEKKLNVVPCVKYLVTKQYVIVITILVFDIQTFE